MSVSKRLKPMRVNNKCREIVYNVYRYFLKEAELFKNASDAKYFLRTQERVVEATKVSKSTFQRIINETTKTEACESTSSYLDDLISGGSNKDYHSDLNESDYDLIRKIVYQYHTISKDSPSFSSLKAKLVEAIEYKGSEKTLRLVLMDMGFQFAESEDRHILIESFKTRLKRIQYLDSIRQYRAEGKNIVYMDEFFFDHIDRSENKKRSTSDQLFLIHAANEKGFIPGALIFKSTDICGEYQKGMSPVNYEKWLRTKLIPNLPSASIVVLDNAPYHNVYVEKPPCYNMAKEEMMNWLKERGIAFDPKLTKPQIYNIICRHKFSEYSVDKILTEHGHIPLRLPAYHPDLNAITRLWSQIKDYLATVANGMDLTSVENVLEEQINMIGSEEWSKYWEDTIKCEDEYRQLEHDLDEYTDSLIMKPIDIGDDADDATFGGIQMNPNPTINIVKIEHIDRF